MSDQKLDSLLEVMPIIAILRGVRPDEVVDIGRAVFDAGIRVIEVPLNSPSPFQSIELLHQAMARRCIIGCGTLTQTTDIEKVADAGGRIVVTPNTNEKVITKCIEAGLTPVPGWATPSDALAAYAAGARHLKLFPATTYGVDHLQAVRAILPTDVSLLAVGGIDTGNVESWRQAGAQGFGIGSDIYQPGLSASQVHRNALKFTRALSSE